MMDAFKDAAFTFINIAEKALDKILEEQSTTIHKLTSILQHAKERRVIVHTVGMGRSGLAAKFFADLLKLYGVKSSVLGDVLAKPVNEGDIVFAFSGSGWTNTTNLYAEMCIRRKAILVAFTATKGSKLARLADISFYLPGKPILHTMDYITRKIFGKYKSPLAPMGSITEFSALVFGAGIASTIDSSNPINEFETSVKAIVSTCKKSFERATNNIDAIARILNIYLDARSHNRTCFFSGLGLLDYITKMVAIRFQHLGLIVGGLSDWILRKPQDILTAVSGSGEAPIPRILTEEAKKSKMTIIAITGNENSAITKYADIYLIVEGAEDRKKFFSVGREPIRKFIPTFEIATLMIFEAIVAEMAYRLGITEKAMMSLHANIE